MRNGHKWLLMIALGFGIGVATAASDRDARLGDYVRHGLISLCPTLTGLNVTLQKEEQGEQAKAEGQ